MKTIYTILVLSGVDIKELIIKLSIIVVVIFTLIMYCLAILTNWEISDLSTTIG